MIPKTLQTLEKSLIVDLPSSVGSPHHVLVTGRVHVCKPVGLGVFWGRLIDR